MLTSTADLFPVPSSLFPLLLDGGMGTLLQERGLESGETPEDWNIERPDDIAAIHRAYVEAGAEVIYANTFGANRLKYHGRHSIEEVVRCGLSIAHRAKGLGGLEGLESRQRNAKVALDLGPTGRLLKPSGDLSFDDAVAAFSETIRIATSQTFQTSQTFLPDLIVIETMGDVRELKAAVIAAKETCDLPIWATVALGSDGKLLTGGSVECVAALLESLGVDAYGFNCGLGPDRMLPYVERLAKVSTKPIIVKPNAGLPKIEDGRTVFTVGPDEFAAHVAKLVSAGASIVGGCCGTTPAHIGRLWDCGIVGLRDCGSGGFSDNPTIRQSLNQTIVSAGASIVGGCCGTTPAHIERLRDCGIVGLRDCVDGEFSDNPTIRQSLNQTIVSAGASIVGGCCGTTPAHIARVREEGRGKREEAFLPSSSLIPHPSSLVSSGTTVVSLEPHQGLIIGERINPTGKKLLKEAYAKGDTAYVLREAVKQVDAGARILDVNCGVPGLDESSLLDATVEAVQSVAPCPIQIDTADPAALERALRHVNGKPLVNSVNGKRESMDAVFPLVRKYGGAIVALCLDESGIPPTSGGRLAIARRILAEGAKYGFTKDDFVFDALTLAVSSDPTAAVVTLETVKRLTDELGVNTVLGVSNVSFGLPNRPALNNAMYALARKAGLSAAIANPAVIRDEIDPAAEDVLMGRDKNCEKWIELQSVSPRTPLAPASQLAFARGIPDFAERTSARSASATASSLFPLPSSLSAAIRRGLKEDAGSAAAAMLKEGVAALEVIEKGIVPALEEVGRGFEQGTVFLPQLLMAADAAGEAFGVVRASCLVPCASCAQSTKHKAQSTIILATVKGDIHDIGKNIVRALLENYGFDVIDLGRDVPPEKIVEAARNSGAMLVGLSALMTTTVGAMAETIRELKAAGLACKTVVGGAVVTQEYADSIGADFYAKDAMRTVRIAESLKT